MSNPITPKANRRIIDGEVLADSQKMQDKKESNNANLKGVWHKVQQSALLMFLSIFGLALVLMVVFLMNNQKNQDWQVESINQLQSQVSKLTTESQSLQAKSTNLEADLKARLVAQEETLEAMEDAVVLLEDNPYNQPIISQADWNMLKFKLQTLDGEVSALANLAKSYSQKLEEFTKNLQAEISQNLDEGMALISPDITQDLERQLTEMATKIADLFAFKTEVTEQEKLEAKDAEEKGFEEKDSEEKAPPEVSPKEVSPLSAMRLQQWVLDINLQWLIVGNIAQTKQSLQALEQAVGLSDYPHKMALARHIGMDLSQLEQDYLLSKNNELEQEFMEFKSWAMGLSYLKSEAPDKEKPPVNSSVGESNLGSIARLQSSFANLFSIQKIEDKSHFSSSERVLIKQGIKQRTKLLMAKMDWAIKVGSREEMEQAVIVAIEFLQNNYRMSENENSNMILTLNRMAKMIPPPRDSLNILQAL